MTKTTLGSRRLVTIVGAGFSGLVTAFHLERAGFRVEVIEEGNRPGGLISTLSRPWGIVETAANGLLNSSLVEELFDAIGIPVLAARRDARRRFIFRGGRPRRWPLGFGATLSLIWFAIRFAFARGALAPRQEETVSAWGTRVMGEEVSRYTIETVLQGIYAGDAARMSASLIFGRFFRKNGFGNSHENSSCALPRARGTVSAPNGMGEVIAKLHTHLEARGVIFHFGRRFDPLDSDFACGQDHPVILATSARAASVALAKIDPELSERLGAIEMLPIVSATVCYRQPIETARGFGCLFPPSENRRALGVLMNGFIFDGRARAGFTETWILGGAQWRERVPRLFSIPSSMCETICEAMTDDEILALIDEERAACFGARSERIGHQITRWPVALPHYTVEMEKALHGLTLPRHNIFLIGNYLGQIGLAKILELASRMPETLEREGSWK